MTDVKRQVVAFRFFDKHAIERKLEKEAEKGWVIEKAGNFIWKYRAAEPKKRHVSLVYFPDASEYDPKPTAGQEMMEELCAQDGWECVATWGQMMFFYNEQENPVPIETDPVLQVANIHRGVKKTMLPQHVFMVLLTLFQLGMNIWNYNHDAVEYLSNGAQLYMGPAWVLLMLTAISEIVRYFVWYFRAKKAAEDGDFYEQKIINYCVWFFDGAAILLILLAALSLYDFGWGMLLWLGTIAVTACSVRLVSGAMKKKGVSRGTNRNVTVAVSVAVSFIAAGMLVAIFIHANGKDDGAIGTYHLNGWTMDVYADDIPLRIEAFIGTADVEWSTEADVQETFLLRKAVYRQTPLTNDRSVPDLRYTITDVKVLSLESAVRKALLNEYRDLVSEDGVQLADHYDEIDPAPWKAVEAYRHYWSGGYTNRYLLFYPGSTVEIVFDEEPTLEQSKMIAEILGK